TAARLNLPSDVTGTIYQLPSRKMVAAAQVLVPNLKRIALVGDSWERQAVRPNYQAQIPAFAAQFEFIDLIGLPMPEIRKRRSFTWASCSWARVRTKVLRPSPKSPTGRS